MQYRKFLFFWQTFPHVVGPNGVRPRASAAGPYKFALRQCRAVLPVELQIGRCKPFHLEIVLME
jgi:hypothetical protein